MVQLEPPRLPGESNKTYGYLLAFCRMGPTRTLAEMGRRFGRTPESFGSFHARRWNWKERVAACDAAVQAADERLVREEREAAERLRLRREVEAREIYWDLSRRLLAVVEPDARGLRELGEVGSLYNRNLPADQLALQARRSPHPGPAAQPPIS